MTKSYNVYLDDTLIGTTKLEKADAPMGVVFGVIQFFNIKIGYDYLKKYCEENQIQVTDYPEDKLISTHGKFDKLKVVNQNDIEIVGVGIQIEGMESEGFEISIQGIPYPFYEEEFPHHVQEYNQMFKDD